MEYYGSSEPQARSYEASEAPLSPAMRMVDWLIVLIICVLPVVNVIVLIIWALDNKGNPNRKSFSQAMLLLFAVEILLMSMFFGYFVGMIYKVLSYV